MHEEAVEKAALPTTSLDASDVATWIDDQKQQLATLDADLKDAKRRIRAAKGPVKKKKAEQPAEDSDGSGSGEA